VRPAALHRTHANYSLTQYHWDSLTTCTFPYLTSPNPPPCQCYSFILSHEQHFNIPNANSDPNERAHFWLPDSSLTTTHELLDSATADRMYIDQGEIVRVRVEADEFYDDEPGPPKASEGVHVMRESRRAPYSVIVSTSFMRFTSSRSGLLLRRGACRR
jgi:hypothetical protein